ncbi:MAG: multiprotein bridging factor aMBF1 [Nanoarchaeota archaeon]
MAFCEMCGKTGSLVSAMIEKVEMTVCANCARFGTVKNNASSFSSTSSSIYKNKVEHKDPALRVISGYASAIRQVRERKGLSQEDFSKLLQERESLVSSWETGKMAPSIDAAKKLERVLKIRLVESDVEESVKPEKSSKADGFTLGDFIKVRKRN